ncbi:MAG: ArsR family transcriptional regulator [Thermoplasmatota archaeon]
MNETRPPCTPPDNAHPRWLALRRYGKALRFRTRWTIIEFIGTGRKSSTDIYDHLTGRGEELTKSGFYYHLNELKKAGIIEVAGYIDEGGGAPEKVWQLKTTKIAISLLPEKEERKS